MDENDDIRKITPVLIREICVNPCPIFEKVIFRPSSVRELLSADSLVSYERIVWVCKDALPHRL